MISQPLIKELQTIISEEYGIRLSLAEAADVGGTLTGYFKTLIKIEGKNRQRDKNDYEKQNKNQKTVC